MRKQNHEWRGEGSLSSLLTAKQSGVSSLEGRAKTSFVSCVQVNYRGELACTVVL